MLTPDYILSAPDFVINQFRDMEDDLIKDIAKSISELKEVDDDTTYRLKMLKEFSAKSEDSIYNRIGIEVQGLGGDIEEILTQAKRQSFKNLEQFEGYKPNSAFADNVIKAIARQSNEEIVNLSKSIGFIFDNKFKSTDDYLSSILNRGIFQISSGAFSYDEIALRYIRELGDKGIRVFNFESGQTREMETHLRRIMTDSVRQLSNEYSKKAAEDLGTDLMEISAHSGARPSHADWQGEIVSLSGRRGYLSLGDIGDGEVDGFGGANCRHSMYPYFEGSLRNYTEEELEDLKTRTVEYDGIQYTDYEATQRQRAMERSLRATQRRIKGFESLGDVKALQAEKTRYRRKLAGYKAYSKGVKKKIRLDNLLRYEG